MQRASDPNTGGKSNENCCGADTRLGCIIDGVEHGQCPMGLWFRRFLGRRWLQRRLLGRLLRVFRRLEGWQQRGLPVPNSRTQLFCPDAQSNPQPSRSQLGWLLGRQSGRVLHQRSLRFVRRLFRRCQLGFVIHRVSRFSRLWLNRLWLDRLWLNGLWLDRQRVFWWFKRKLVHGQLLSGPQLFSTGLLRQRGTDVDRTRNNLVRREPCIRSARICDARQHGG